MVFPRPTTSGGGSPAQINPDSDPVRFANLRRISTLAACSALDGT